ncbi:TonB family protein [Myxococcota bacterium]|nr:TonB family protein [Myxococcota bacterium]
MKKLGVLVGMIEAGKAMPMVSKQHKMRLASLYAGIAAEPWAFFSSPKAEFEDLGLALSLENKRLDMVASFTQTGREAYQAGRNNSAPTLRSRAKDILAEGSLDADIPAILQKLKDAFPWSKGIVDRSLPLGADSWTTKQINQIRLKVVGFGADNYMVMTATPRLQKAADGRVVPQEIVVKAFLRAPPIKPQEETHGEIPLARPIILGSLSKKVIGRIVRRWSSRMRYCYERQLIQHPELAGRLVVFFVINPKGRVQTAKIASATLKNRPLERCVVSIFRAMRFPAPFGGGIVHVRYPLLFRPEAAK